LHVAKVLADSHSFGKRESIERPEKTKAYRGEMTFWEANDIRALYNLGLSTWKSFNV
jgi:hypothetical protein